MLMRNLASRAIASGTRSGGCSDREGRPWSGCHRSPGVQTALGLDRQREPQRPAITSQLSSPTCCQRCQSARWSSALRPSIGVARKEEGYNPRAFNQIGTKPPGQWDNADKRNTATAPESEPVNPASGLVAHGAVRGTRASAENSGRRASRYTDSTPLASGCVRPSQSFVATAMKPGT